MALTQQEYEQAINAADKAARGRPFADYGLGREQRRVYSEYLNFSIDRRRQIQAQLTQNQGADRQTTDQLSQEQYMSYANPSAAPTLREQSQLRSIANPLQRILPGGSQQSRNNPRVTLPLPTQTSNQQSSQFQGSRVTPTQQEIRAQSSLPDRATQPGQQQIRAAQEAVRRVLAQTRENLSPLYRGGFTGVQERFERGVTRFSNALGTYTEKGLTKVGISPEQQQFDIYVRTFPRPSAIPALGFFEFEPSSPRQAETSQDLTRLYSQTASIPASRLTKNVEGDINKPTPGNLINPLNIPRIKVGSSNVKQTVALGANIGSFFVPVFGQTRTFIGVTGGTQRAKEIVDSQGFGGLAKATRESLTRENELAQLEAQKIDVSKPAGISDYDWREFYTIEDRETYRREAYEYNKAIQNNINQLQQQRALNNALLITGLAVGTVQGAKLAKPLITPRTTYLKPGAGERNVFRGEGGVVLVTESTPRPPKVTSRTIIDPVSIKDNAVNLVSFEVSRDTPANFADKASPLGSLFFTPGRIQTSGRRVDTAMTVKPLYFNDDGKLLTSGLLTTQREGANLRQYYMLRTDQMQLTPQQLSAMLNKPILARPDASFSIGRSESFKIGRSSPSSGYIDIYNNPKGIRSIGFSETVPFADIGGKRFFTSKTISRPVRSDFRVNRRQRPESMEGFVQVNPSRDLGGDSTGTVIPGSGRAIQNTQVSEKALKNILDVQSNAARILPRIKKRASPKASRKQANAVLGFEDAAALAPTYTGGTGKGISKYFAAGTQTEDITTSVLNAPINSPDQYIRPAVDFLPLAATPSKQSPIQRTPSREKFRTDTIPFVATVSSNAFVPTVNQPSRSAQTPLTIPRQPTRTVQKPRIPTSSRNPLVPRFPKPKIPRPKVPKEPLKVKTPKSDSPGEDIFTPKKSKSAKFTSFTFRRGKPVKVASGDLGTALGAAIKRVKGSLAASFYIEDVSGKKVKVNAPGFVPGKRDPFRVVQPRGQRLSARSEVAEIISAKRIGRNSFI